MAHVLTWLLLFDIGRFTVILLSYTLTIVLMPFFAKQTCKVPLKLSLLGAKSIPEPMPTYCEFDPEVKKNSEIRIKL